MVPRIPNLTVGLVAALLLGLACAAPPTQGLSTRPAGSDSNARRAKAGASKLHNTPSIASATKMAAARMKRMQKTPSPGTTMARGSTRAHSEAKGLRAAVGRHLKRSDFKAQMRKTIERSGVVETAQALRRTGVTMTQALTDIFIAYDTDALSLSALGRPGPHWHLQAPLARPPSTAEDHRGSRVYWFRHRPVNSTW